MDAELICRLRRGLPIARHPFSESEIGNVAEWTRSDYVVSERKLAPAFFGGGRPLTARSHNPQTASSMRLMSSNHHRPARAKNPPERAFPFSHYVAYPYHVRKRCSFDLEERKTVRGGSFHDRPCRAAFSYCLGYHPCQGVFNVGFRIVIEE